MHPETVLGLGFVALAVYVLLFPSDRMAADQGVAFQEFFDACLERGVEFDDQNETRDRLRRSIQEARNKVAFLAQCHDLVQDGVGNELSVLYDRVEMAFLVRQYEQTVIIASS